MSIHPKFVELTADVLEIFFYNMYQVKYKFARSIYMYTVKKTNNILIRCVELLLLWKAHAERGRDHTARCVSHLPAFIFSYFMSGRISRSRTPELLQQYVYGRSCNRQLFRWCIALKSEIPQVTLTTYFPTTPHLFPGFFPPCGYA